jgi:thiamine-phosphate pyrophosphorylase
VRPPLDLIGRARQRFTVPLVGIGGISAANAPQLITAGISAIAVISAVFSAPDIEAAAREFQSLFELH